MEVTDRFKGLDLIDRMPKELWTELTVLNCSVGENPWESPGLQGDQISQS